MAGGTLLGFEQFALGGTITLAAGQAQLDIDRATGLIRRYAADGRRLASGAAPHVWRAVADNDPGKMLAPA
ncbi:hypothetical protein M9979_07240 [Sphingomonas sp. RP10(2022)]|uniref:Uncharacterized protein n=1 Tax=Sphingomonas liriopis TaxID=2949094 RepID=A0A9X2HPA8_9SPHN|nr:hypothetical protein [Sphingomonas liriopis]MCP3734663.1 hypothetical protein [Sphingomonas liriopis]